MLFTTATQFAVLALCLIAGWIFGLASTSGGRRWREKYRAEEAAHAAYRKDAEARIAAAETRARELDAAHERSRQVTAVPGQPLSGIAGARVAATTSARPAASAAAVPAGIGASRNWIGGSRDDLTRIRGVDETRARALTDLGVRSYADIERLDAEDEREVELRLALPAGTIATEHWRDQAAMLARGEEDAHRSRFWR